MDANLIITATCEFDLSADPCMPTSKKLATDKTRK
jgi:hypothetical protein